jgi:vitamin B12 transporter
MNHQLAASIRRLIILAGIAPATVSTFAQANIEPQTLPKYVLTGTRTPAALTTTGSHISTLSAAELARMQLTNLQSALAGAAGSPAFASGARGGATALFLRGANSNQTLFLVDGIRFNDPNTNYEVALGGMCVSACDSLEIAHGPQSTLYGGEAIGGVVSLRAQRGVGPASYAIAAEAGSFGTVQGSLRAQGGDDKSGYNFSVVGGTTENDRPNNDFTSATYALRLDRTINDDVSVGATYRGFVGEYGSPGDRFTNDLNNTEKESNQLATVFAEFTPTSTFSSKVVVGGQYRRFESINPNAAGTSVSTTVVTNRRSVLDWQNTLSLGDQHRVTAGLTAEANHTRNTGFGSIDESQQLFAFFLQDEWTPVERVYLTAGLRSDDHDTFGRATTGRVTAAWLSSNSRFKLRSSFGTAFRAPSFLDLYGQSTYYVGNPDLKAEKARGWDAGVDYFFANNQGVLSATYFDTRLRNLIVYDFAVSPSTMANIEKARTHGVELAAKFTLPGAVEVRASYTYLEADNLTQGIRLLRRPRHSGSLDVWHDFGRGFSAGVGGVLVSGRRDVHAGNYTTIDAEDYSVVRIYAAWQVNARLALKARVENALDERYEEVHGFPQPGVGAYAGLEWKF